MQYRGRLLRIIAGAVLLATGLLCNPEELMPRLALYLAGYLLVGGDIVWKAVRNILRGQVFDESFLMAVATIGAFALGVYPEGVAVMLFYQVGELFQSFAVDKSRKSIVGLMDIRPDYANVRRPDGSVETMDPYDVEIGDIIVIKAGEKVPLDAQVLEGNSMLDTTALTGESVPREVEPGQQILSGCINLNGLLAARVIKNFGESTVTKILDLVENAGSKKSKSENFITKFARYYTPIVVAAAVLLAVVPPLVWPGARFSDWVYNALTFLVISCPCALVISVPMGFFGGIGCASRRGILVKGGNYLEALAQTEIVVFDKTGTLTKGVFQVQKIEASGMSREELLELAAYAESYSNHPISDSIRKAYGRRIEASLVSGVEEISGHGVGATVRGKRVFAGNGKLMEKIGVSHDNADIAGTTVHVAADGTYAGYIVIADQVKEDAAGAIARLKAENIKQTVMLTGDAKQVGERVAQSLGLDQVYTELLPADKVERVEELFARKSPKGKLAFVGDGINDAPVLARADIGVAMGGLGSDAAIEAADVVIMTDEPSKLPDAISISRRTLRIVRQNIVFALAVKGIVLLLGACGISSMWEAVFADVGVSILAILNSLRVMRIKNIQ